MEKLSSQVKIYWIIKSLITGLILGTVLSVGLHISLGFLWLTVLALLFLPTLFSLFSIYRYRNWGFEVKNSYLSIQFGVITKVSMKIPYVRVQHIDTNRGPIERILGLASVRVYTAGSSGADIRIPGLKRSRAEELQKELKEKAIESEKGFDGV